MMFLELWEVTHGLDWPSQPLFLGPQSPFHTVVREKVLGAHAGPWVVLLPRGLVQSCAGHRSECLTYLDLPSRVHVLFRKQS